MFIESLTQHRICIPQKQTVTKYVQQETKLYRSHTK